MIKFDDSPAMRFEFLFGSITVIAIIWIDWWLWNVPFAFHVIAEISYVSSPGAGHWLFKFDNLWLSGQVNSTVYWKWIESVRQGHTLEWGNAWKPLLRSFCISISSTKWLIYNRRNSQLSRPYPSMFVPRLISL